jgi:hypothetical protein
MKKIRNLILFLIPIVVFITLIAINLKNNKSKKTVLISVSPTKTVSKTLVNLSNEDIKKYDLVYQNPYVLFLRKALDVYLTNSNEMDIPKIVAQANTQDGIINGLDSFNKDYYKSKFVVININNNIAGGKNIEIIFQDKPDRVFYAWVYQLAGGTYELRGFYSKEKIDKKALEEMIDYLSPLLFDKAHAL